MLPTLNAKHAMVIKQRFKIYEVVDNRLTMGIDLNEIKKDGEFNSIADAERRMQTLPNGDYIILPVYKKQNIDLKR